LDRVVGHIDLDYFYAQVEEVEDPSIKGRPVMVCVFSGRTAESGVVSTANYNARALGVRSGMSIAAAKRLLEGHDPVVVRMAHEKYEAVSERVMDVVSEHVDVLEKTGIDEAFFDITSSSGGDYSKALRLAQELKDSVFRREMLTSSVGLGRSKVVAKLGSDSAKPGGLLAIPPESTASFLSPLPVTKLYGVGPKTAAALQAVNVVSVGELSRCEPSLLEERFGRKLAVYLIAAARGEDSDSVSPSLGPTQFSRMVTLKRDTRDVDDALGQLQGGLEDLKRRLVGSGKSFRTLSVIGILTDLSTKTRSRTFEAPVRDLSIMQEAVPALLAELMTSTDRALRRAGIRVSELSDSADQTSLFQYAEGGS
jgi:DNA polymerase IV (archaeal DinB-like DNA polymerase)